MFTVSPSIYSGDLLHLADQLDALKDIETLHLDIDDGTFVRGISFGMAMVEQIAAYTDIPLDAHIESVDPMQFASPLCKAGAWLVTAHIEALPFPSLFLSTVHAEGKKAGLALNLKTPVEALAPYADSLDQILIVCSEADCDGLPFRRGALEKIRRARELLGADALVWADGGINENNLADVVRAGADGIVLGRAVFCSPDPMASWRKYVSLGTSAQQEG